MFHTCISGQFVRYPNHVCLHKATHINDNKEQQYAIQYSIYATKLNFTSVGLERTAGDLISGRFGKRMNLLVFNENR